MSGQQLMKKFNEFFEHQIYQREIETPSAEVQHSVYTLQLRFDSKDILYQAFYQGPQNPWMSSLCYLIQGKTLSELNKFSIENWKASFKDDQSFWDFYQEEEEQFVFWPTEFLRAALDTYRGRDYLYKETSPLVCRCFGVREKDILEHLQKEEIPTLETLGNSSSAGMGCRTCVPQLKRWLAVDSADKRGRFFKEKSAANWVTEIDYLLSCFPQSLDWKMEIISFNQGVVMISYDKEVSQKEEEAIGHELQRFLGAALDSDLSFFLRRARHFSKARG
jgi:hypothetical protein